MNSSTTKHSCCCINCSPVNLDITFVEVCWCGLCKPNAIAKYCFFQGLFSKEHLINRSSTATQYCIMQSHFQFLFRDWQLFVWDFKCVFFSLYGIHVYNNSTCILCFMHSEKCIQHIVICLLLAYQDQKWTLVVAPPTLSVHNKADLFQASLLFACYFFLYFTAGVFLEI